MIFREVVLEMQEGYKGLQSFLPLNTKLIYECLAEDDEDMVSFVGCFLLVAPRNGQAGYYDVLARLDIPLGLYGPTEEIIVQEVRQWLEAYPDYKRLGSQNHYQFVVETTVDGMPRFLPNGEIEPSQYGGNVFSQILSRD